MKFELLDDTINIQYYLQMLVHLLLITLAYACSGNNKLGCALLAGMCGKTYCNCSGHYCIPNIKCIPCIVWRGGIEYAKICCDCLFPSVYNCDGCKGVTARTGCTNANMTVCKKSAMVCEGLCNCFPNYDCAPECLACIVENNDDYYGKTCCNCLFPGWSGCGN